MKTEFKSHADAISYVKKSISQALIAYVDVARDVGFGTVSIAKPFYDKEHDGDEVSHVGNEVDNLVAGNTIAHVGLIQDAKGFMDMPLSFFNPQKMDDHSLLCAYMEKFKHIWKTHMNVMYTVSKHIDDRRRWAEMQIRFYQSILGGFEPESSRDKIIQAAQNLQHEMILTLATLKSAREQMIESRKEFLLAANRVHCALPEGVVEDYGEKTNNKTTQSIPEILGHKGSGVLVLDGDDDEKSITEKIRKAIEQATGGKIIAMDAEVHKVKKDKIGFNMPGKEDDDDKVH